MERVFREAEQAKFSWGEWDCANFVAKVIQAKCGKDVAEPFRGKYSDRRGAYMVIKEFCGGGLLTFARKLAELHGFKEISVFHAQRGDVVAVSTSKGVALGVVDLSGTSLALMNITMGLVRRPLSDGMTAWRIE